MAIAYRCRSIGIGITSGAVGGRQGLGHSVAGAAQAVLHAGVRRGGLCKHLRLAVGLRQSRRLCTSQLTRSPCLLVYFLLPGQSACVQLVGLRQYCRQGAYGHHIAQPHHSAPEVSDWRVVSMGAVQFPA